jgi:hypothetical protein
MKKGWVTPSSVLGVCGLITSVATVVGIFSGAFSKMAESESFPATKGYVHEYGRKPSPTLLEIQIENADGKHEATEGALAKWELDLAKLRRDPQATETDILKAQAEIRRLNMQKRLQEEQRDHLRAMRRQMQ